MSHLEQEPTESEMVISSHEHDRSSSTPEEKFRSANILLLLMRNYHGDLSTEMKKDLVSFFFAIMKSLKYVAVCDWKWETRQHTIVSTVHF